MEAGVQEQQPLDCRCAGARKQARGANNSNLPPLLREDDVKSADVLRTQQGALLDILLP